jgi:signal transduction histidine kinase
MAKKKTDILKNPMQLLEDLSFVINNFLLPIVILDPKGQIRRFNKPWLEMFGTRNQSKNYVNTSYFDFLKTLEQKKVYSSETKKKIEGVLKKCISTKFRPKPIEFTVGKKWYLNNIHAIYNNNKLMGFIIVHQNMTTWKQKELILQSEKNKTFESSQRRMFFLANLNHELKSPLNSIMGFSQLLKEKITTHKESSGFSELIDNISEAANHLNSIVFRILDMAKIESGTLVLQEEDISPRKLLQLSVNLVQPLFPGRKIEVECLCEQTEKLKCDKNLAMEVIINLLVNSLKFSKESVYLKCSVTKDEGLIVSVSDKGPGMTKEEIKVALEPFGQNLRAPEDKNTGLGLGVPFCHQIMTLHKGSLKIESKKGKGTVVNAIFPPHRVII